MQYPTRNQNNLLRSIDLNKTTTTTGYQKPIVTRQFIQNIQGNLEDDTHINFITTKDIEQKWQKQLQTSLRINSITQQLEDNLFMQSHAI